MIAAHPAVTVATPAIRTRTWAQAVRPADQGANLLEQNAAHVRYLVPVHALVHQSEHASVLAPGLTKEPKGPLLPVNLPIQEIVQLRRLLKLCLSRVEPGT